MKHNAWVMGIVGSLAIFGFLAWYWSDVPVFQSKTGGTPPLSEPRPIVEPRITDDIVLEVRRSVRELAKSNVENGKWTKKSDCKIKPMDLTTTLLVKFAVAEYEEACPKAVQARNTYLREAREARYLFTLATDSPELETARAKQLMSRFRAFKPTTN